MSAPMARITIAALAACALTACTGNADPGPDTDSAPDRPLRGTTWSLTTLIESKDGVDEHTAVDPGTAEVTLLIAEDGAVSGSGGCNRLIGTATVRDETPTTATIAFQLGSTMMMCAPEAMAVENAVLTTLAAETHSVISGDTLTLRTDDGRGLILLA